MTEQIKLVADELEKNIKPFTDKLIEKNLKESAEKILVLIRAIESDPVSNCITLYNLLQFHLLNAVEKYGVEAAESLNDLYALMTKVYAEILIKMSE